MEVDISQVTDRALLQFIQRDQAQLFLGFARAEKSLKTLTESVLGLKDLNLALTLEEALAPIREEQTRQRSELEELRGVLEFLVPTTFHFFINGKEITMADLQSTQELEVTLVITKGGKPGQVQDPPVWTSSDEKVATVTSSPDGLSAVVRAVKDGDGGVCQITATGDADLGAGVKPVTGFITVTVQGATVVFELKAGAPREQTA